jgi:hypothetical protein
MLLEHGSLSRQAREWIKTLRTFEYPEMATFIDNHLTPRQAVLERYVEELKQEIGIELPEEYTKKTVKYFECFIAVQTS